jgi:hypothetical protein
MMEGVNSTIVRTFENVTIYHQYNNNNIKRKKKGTSGHAQNFDFR